MKQYTIGDVSKRLGISRDSLRFMKKRGSSLRRSWKTATGATAMRTRESFSTSCSTGG